MKTLNLKRSENNKYSKKEALSVLTKLCSREEKCTRDISEKLDNWKISSADAKEIIDYLIKENYIDESRYAKHFASDKFRFNKWGKYKISFALKQKHIPEFTIKSAFEAIPDEEYRAVLFEELSKKLRSFPKTSEYELKGKLYRFAAGRGYENDIVLDILNELFAG